jgi:hypothetical protein
MYEEWRCSSTYYLPRHWKMDCVQPHASAAFHSGITPRVQLARGCWRCRGRLDAMEKINLLPLPGIEPRFLGRASLSLVTMLTEISELPTCDT